MGGGRGGNCGGGSGPAKLMQLGCAFVKGDMPVLVGYDGQIAILPQLLPPKDYDDNNNDGGDPPAWDDVTLYVGEDDRSRVLNP
jgi:hypothetical protein